MGRITISPEIALNRVIDDLRRSLYKTSYEKENMEALENIIASPIHERAAFVNGNFSSYPLDHIFLASEVTDRVDLNKVQKRIETLEDKIAELDLEISRNG